MNRNRRCSSVCRQSLQSILKKRIGRSSDNRALRNRAARPTSKSDVLRACGRWPFPFLRNDDYLTPAFTDSPPLRPLRSPARATRTAHFTKAPAGGWRSLPKRSGTQDSSLLGQRQKKLVRAENSLPDRFPCWTLNCK